LKSNSNDEELEKESDSKDQEPIQNLKVCMAQGNYGVPT
jgi:hypothetical protein